MTTFGLIVTILGAASVSVNLMRLVESLEHPKQRRRRMA